MQRYFKYKLNKHDRQLSFLAENIADFPPVSPGGRKIAAFRAEVAKCKELAARQQSGANDSKMHVDNKGDAFDEILRLLKMMSRAALAMDDEIPNLEAKFQLPRSRSQPNLIIAARAFYTDSEGFESEFITYDLPETFRADLLALISKAETTINAVNVSTTDLGQATGSLKDSMRIQTRLSEQIDSIVRNKYEWNPGLMAAWEIASHLERAPRRARKETTAEP